jgi:hypothetical protein
MRIARSTLGTAAAALIVLALGAAPASAGGPTSVLIANPTSGTAAALYFTDPDYATLQDALEPGGVAVSDPPTLASGPGPGAINVTWLIHDVSVWRVDRIRLDASPDVWVQTDLTDADGVGLVGASGWHAASDAAAVYEVLGRLGVLAGGTPVGADAVGKAGPAIKRDDTLGGVPVRQAAVSGAAEGDGSSGSGSAWWLVPGVVAGAMLGAIARPLVADAMARRRTSGPRHELIDL